MTVAVRVEEAVATRVTVFEGTNVIVGLGVRVALVVALGERLAVELAVYVAAGDIGAVAVILGVPVESGVRVRVAVRSAVGEALAVTLALGVAVAAGNVRVGVLDRVAVGD